MNSLDTQYLNILADILNDGHKKRSRTGVDTLSIFRREIRHNMSEGFPLLTTKKVAFELAIKELMWFISGSTDIRKLWKTGVHIWDGDWYKKYSESCSEPYSLEEMIDFAMNPDNNPTRSRFFHNSLWSLGPIYGHQWRNWGSEGSITKVDLGSISNIKTYNKAINYIQKGKIIDAIKLGAILTENPRKGIDQFKSLLNTLKDNPDSRRMVVNAWNVDQLDQMTLPPCHYSFEVYTRELTLNERKTIFTPTVKFPQIFFEQFNNDEELMDYFDTHYIPKREISLAWTQRSADFPLGVPFNLVCYGALLLMLAHEFNMIPGELVGTFTDCHIYDNQIEGVQQQLERKPFDNLPQISVRDGIYSTVEDFIFDSPYEHHPSISFPLSN